MKYDDASWHYGGDFPGDLDEINSYTHIAMFLVWALLSDLGGEFHQNNFAEELQLLHKKKITPGKYFECCCDEKLTCEDLNDLGNEFASGYYEKEYYSDYSDLFIGYLSIYSVEDTWDNFDKVHNMLDNRFAETVS